ncbi:hypothetical protein LMxysn_2176 [Listeria monocytogenes]|nr:hypothetical protein LMxysn_2176 [Listeria monocytogenes]
MATKINKMNEAEENAVDNLADLLRLATTFGSLERTRKVKYITILKIIEAKYRK